jgi:hypothetical protein
MTHPENAFVDKLGLNSAAKPVHSFQVRPLPLIAICAIGFFLTELAQAEPPTPQQRIDRIHGVLEGLATSQKNARTQQIWKHFLTAATAGAVSAIHWVDFASIPATQVSERQHATVWGVASGLLAVASLYSGTVKSFASHPSENWTAQALTFAHLKGADQLDAYEGAFQDRVRREKEQRLAEAAQGTLTGLVVVTAGFFFRDSVVRGLLWFAGGAMTGMSAPGFFVPGPYQRAYEDYRGWSDRGTQATAQQPWQLWVQPRDGGLSLALNLFW